MSADIIRFIPRPRNAQEPTDYPTIAFGSLEPAPQSRSRAFSFVTMLSTDNFKDIDAVSLLKSRLTRRANHRHIFIIAKIMRSPRGENPPRAFLLKHSHRRAVASVDEMISPGTVQTGAPCEVVSQ